VARRTKVIKINDRDRELTFEITEMPCERQLDWITRALIFVAPLLDIDESKLSVQDLGTVANAVHTQFTNYSGLAKLKLLNPSLLKELLGEMQACCVRTDGGIRQVCTPGATEGFIEDVGTLITLHIESLKLNLQSLIDYFQKKSTIRSSQTGSNITSS
jgi:hypothetical protein